MRLLLCLLAALTLAGPASAAPYSQPYTAAFGTDNAGHSPQVVFFVFDASGVCRVGPTSFPGDGGGTVTGPGNEPTITESKDYSGTGGTGCYLATLPLDTSWGPLHIKTVITGVAGVVAEGSLANRGPDSADGWTPLLASKTDAALPSAVAGQAGGLIIGDASGRVTLVPGQVAVVGSTAPAWYTSSPTAQAVASLVETALFAHVLATGVTFGRASLDVWGTTSGPMSSATHGLVQTTHYLLPDGTTPQHSSVLTLNFNGNPVSRTISVP